jgi:hypothetical protein
VLIGILEVQEVQQLCSNMAGGSPPVTNATEEWLAPTGAVTKTFTTS